jgi:hypothetical protein
MQRLIKGIYVPGQVWFSPQLTLLEKAILIEIDSYEKKNPSISTLASAIGADKKEVREAISTLYKKGALSVSVDENGTDVYTAFMYKDSYAMDVTKGNIEKEQPKDVKMIDYDFIEEQWNTINANLPRVTRFTPQRKSRIRTVLRENAIGVDDVIKAFKIIRVSDFLNGRIVASNGSTWKADFDWLFKKTETIRKVLEGNYTKSYNEADAYRKILAGTDTAPQDVSEEDSIYK